MPFNSVKGVSIGMEYYTESGQRRGCAVPVEKYRTTEEERSNFPELILVEHEMVSAIHALEGLLAEYRREQAI